MTTTDDAPALIVLASILNCARSWVPEARIIGNVRAGDIVRSLEEAATLRRERDEARDGIRIAVELLDADCLIEAHEKLISVIGELK